MCVTSKIQQIQMELMSVPFPKSGVDTFHKSKYHQLEDILPPIMKACDKHDLVLLFNFTTDQAVLDVTDKNNVENYYRFTIPMPELTQLNKKSNLVQSLGANVTYLKRYLLMNAFLIFEEDIIEAIVPEEETVSDDNIEDVEEIPAAVKEAVTQVKKEGAPLIQKNIWSKVHKILPLGDPQRKTCNEYIHNNYPLSMESK